MLRPKKMCPPSIEGREMDRYWYLSSFSPRFEHFHHMFVRVLPRPVLHYMVNWLVGEHTPQDSWAKPGVLEWEPVGKRSSLVFQGSFDPFNLSATRNFQGTMFNGVVFFNEVWRVKIPQHGMTRYVNWTEEMAYGRAVPLGHKMANGSSLWCPPWCISLYSVMVPAFCFAFCPGGRIRKEVDINRYITNTFRKGRGYKHALIKNIHDKMEQSPET